MEIGNEIVGTSPAICDVFDLIRKVASTDMPVLITSDP
jgi:DNA-binding NtrC family response regulator